ncbi:DUF1937 family protein [Thalassoglobus sp.]|uniref:DUF1937 family protein n=1 Tax=Thalassoglobus sp. TaxID=2795869 RepID=UPI003AA7CF9A
MIYLASPYSHEDQSVRELRFHAACRVTADLIRHGQAVYSPVVHAHPLTKQNLPTDWSFWKSIDEELLGYCDALLVLQLDGWKESVGVQAEIVIAQQFGKPIWYHNPADWSARLPRVTEVKRCGT